MRERMDRIEARMNPLFDRIAASYDQIVPSV